MSNHKTGFFAIVGETNAGKSTLINRLIGKKISIVTHKVQTTRGSITGIFTQGNSQVVIVDTPGLFDSKTESGSRMLGEAWNTIYQVENIVFIIDISKKYLEKSIQLLDKIKDKNIVLVFNKIDKVKKDVIPTLIEKFSSKFGIKDIFLISALRNDGVDDLKSYLLSLCQEEEWAFDKNAFTDVSFEKFVAEITREKIYEFLHKEIPYYCDVETLRVDGDDIYQKIYVRKESHKPIVIGRHGSKIRSIGTAARLELSLLFKRNYNLFLTVELVTEH